MVRRKMWFQSMTVWFGMIGAIIFALRGDLDAAGALVMTVPLRMRSADIVAVKRKRKPKRQA